MSFKIVKLLKIFLQCPKLYSNNYVKESKAKMIKPKIAFIDAGSFGLSYDCCFLNAIINEVDVDFFYSKTKYSFVETEKLDMRISCSDYSISGSITSRIYGFLSYCYLLLKLFKNKNHYQYIHFNWSLIPSFDSFILPILFKKKLIYSLHNVVPHEHKFGNVIYEHQLSKKSTKLILLSDYAYNISEKLNKNRFLLQHGFTLEESGYSSKMPSECFFVGNIKPYKGIDNFINLAEIRKGKESFHIFGKWDKSLAFEKKRAEHNCQIIDDYIDDDKFRKIFSSQKAVFILPYLNISQSGILFNIIGGCQPFIGSDIGDISLFAKRIGYPQILFKPNDLVGMDRALHFCIQNHNSIKEAICKARHRYRWKYDQELLRKIYYE